MRLLISPFSRRARLIGVPARSIVARRPRRKSGWVGSRLKLKTLVLPPSRSRCRRVPPKNKRRCLRDPNNGSHSQAKQGGQPVRHTSALVLRVRPVASAKRNRITRHESGVQCAPAEQTNRASRRFCPEHVDEDAHSRTEVSFLRLVLGLNVNSTGGKK